MHLNLNATVGHDTIFGDFVSVNPLASVSGELFTMTGCWSGWPGWC